MVLFQMCLVCLCSIGCNGAVLGEACTDDSSCTNSDAKCDNLKCACADTYFQNGDNCVQKKAIGDTCTSVGTKTECSDSNSVCTTEVGGSKCRCTSQYYDNDLNDANIGGTCTLKKAIGDTCTSVGTKTECSDSNSVCTNEVGGNKCRCTSQYYDNDLNDANIGGTCTQKKANGDTCTSVGTKTECLDSNSVCTSEVNGSKCRCTSQYYDNDLDDANIGGLCFLKLQSGVVCFYSVQCTAFSTCQNNVCTCSDGYYDSNFDVVNGLCVAKLQSGVGCTNSVQCTAFSTCQNHVCTCSDGYYDSYFYAANGLCVAKKAIGDICTSVGTKTECSDSYSVCTSENGGSKCRCTSQYYDNDLNDANVGGTCTQKKVLGDSCTASIQCIEANSECTTKCQCQLNFYDTNNNGSGGSCQPCITKVEQTEIQDNSAIIGVSIIGGIGWTLFLVLVVIMLLKRNLWMGNLKHSEDTAMNYADLSEAPDTSTYSTIALEGSPEQYESVVPMAEYINTTLTPT